jgi:hypothetical protein
MSCNEAMNSNETIYNENYANLTSLHSIALMNPIFTLQYTFEYEVIFVNCKTLLII